MTGFYIKCNTGLKWVNQLATTTTEDLLSRHTNQDILAYLTFYQKKTSLLAFTCSKSTMEIPKPCVRSFQI